LKPASKLSANLRGLIFFAAALFAAALSLLAAGRTFTTWASVKPILDQQRERLPAQLKNPTETKWIAWSRQQDKAIRARLEQGELDSMVNLLLYGASFTRQPRIAIEHITEASKAGLLRMRVDDLVAGLRNPGANERLVFLKRLLRTEGIDPEAPDGPSQTGKYILENLLRVVEERKAIAERAAAAKTAPAPDDPSSLLDRFSLFQDRGVSLDTGIIPDFSIEQTLRDLKQRGLLREGQIARVAVIGPGLDFIDKNEDSAFDYYPQQTLQPFAFYDSLLRLRLAKPAGLSMSIFDISTRVIEHIQRARERASKNTPYDIQLPRDVARPWPTQLISWWNTLGDQVGINIPPIAPPAIFPDLKTRAIRVRPDVVLACEPSDLNIVLERPNLAPADRFDLIVATNIFVYYDAFEQTLALENAGATLKQGGLLLTNDRLPTFPGGSMQLAGVTVVPYNTPGVRASQAVGWYRKQ
jgi:hypothetical protein